MSGSWFQAIKDAIPIPAPAVLVLAGLGCYLITCLVARRPLTWGWALLPGVVLSIALESWEVWEHYGATGLGGSSVLGILGRHSKDVFLLNALPAMVFVIASILKK